jgi:hypothetical protein
MLIFRAGRLQSRYLPSAGSPVCWGSQHGEQNLDARAWLHIGEECQVSGEGPLRHPHVVASAERHSTPLGNTAQTNLARPAYFLKDDRTAVFVDARTARTAAFVRYGW